MIVHDTPLNGVKLIQLKVHRDDRGLFAETFELARYQEALQLPGPFVQDNFSSSKQNVLRGLHFQQRRPQGKLLRVLSGRIYDVVVDLRLASPTFGQWHALTLESAQFLQLWVPPGLAHGFAVLSEEAQIAYQCTDYYDPGAQFSLLWDDPHLSIPWPVAAPILSERDRRGWSWPQVQRLLQGKG